MCKVLIFLNSCFLFLMMHFKVNWGLEYTSDIMRTPKSGVGFTLNVRRMFARSGSTVILDCAWPAPRELVSQKASKAQWKPLGYRNVLLTIYIPEMCTFSKFWWLMVILRFMISRFILSINIYLVIQYLAGYTLMLLILQGTPRIQSFSTLCTAWVIIACCLLKGVKTSGRWVYRRSRKLKHPISKVLQWLAW